MSRLPITFWAVVGVYRVEGYSAGALAGNVTPSGRLA
jgi:hypothetical protein